MMTVVYPTAAYKKVGKCVFASDGSSNLMTFKIIAPETKANKIANARLGNWRNTPASQPAKIPNVRMYLPN